ncbi:MAG: peptidase sortase [Candidatus Saccharibacteria bacterium]|nr:peptidase sortase [Candidatus Saccharibacteria bacterium]
MVTKKRTSFSKHLAFPAALLALGLALACAAVILYLHNKQAEPKPPPGALTSLSASSSVKPKAQAVATYTVPPNNPKYISIPAISTGNVRVFKLGLLRNGSIAVPSNIYDTGWYDGSVKPGQGGAMFIYGHVSSWTANGVFYNLKKLSPGDTITITRGDNTTYKYKVVSTRNYPYNNVDMNQVLAPINPNKPGLNLMTCTGKIIKGTSDFDERLVVFTSLVTS